ncbi:hypothetical protein D3C78_1580370 [compost metagenome]
MQTGGGRVWIIQIQSGRSDLIAQRQGGENGFQAACGSQQMAGGRFGGGDSDMPIGAEQVFDGVDFTQIANRG